MAWSILFLQSEGILKLRQPPPEAAADGLTLSEPPDDGYLGSLQTPEQLDVTTAVLGAPDGPPLTPMIRHSETRPVSLLELVSAFGEAEEQARRSLKIQALRERLREEQRTTPEVLVHGDIPERDLQETWTAAKQHPVGEPFPFLSLWKVHQGREHLVSLFLASLFLVRERAIELRQERLGDSPIELVRLTEERPKAVEM
jgi:hypothetical protein